MASLQLSQFQSRQILPKISTSTGNLGHYINEFSFDQVMQRVEHMPAHSLFLGMAGDELPVYFDWKDSKISSLLLINDHISSIQRLMQTMIKSMSLVNSNEDIQYIMISNSPDHWMKLIAEGDPNYDFCGGVVGSEEIGAEDWIIYLAQKVEHRLNGRQWGASIILFLDDYSIIDKLDIRTRMNFEWLVKYGARVNIWTIAGFDVSKCDRINLVLGQFSTKIYGQIESKLHPKLNEHIPSPILDTLFPNRHFVTKIGSEWIRFWAPKLQG